VKTNHALSYIMIGLMAAILMAVPVGSSASAGLAENAAGVWFIGLGDSLTHGAMDGANNILNTENAWLQKTADVAFFQSSTSIHSTLLWFQGTTV